MYAEDNSQTVELHFEKHEMYNRRIVAKCHSGYELYRDLVCGTRPNCSVGLHTRHFIINFSRSYPVTVTEKGPNAGSCMYKLHVVV